MTRSPSEHSLAIFRLAATWRQRPPRAPGVKALAAVGLIWASRTGLESATSTAQWAMGRRLIVENAVGDLATVITAGWTVGLVLGAAGSWPLILWVLYPGLLVCAALSWLLYRWPVTRPAIVVADTTVSTAVAVLVACVLGMQRGLVLAAHALVEAARVFGRSLSFAARSTESLLAHIFLLVCTGARMVGEILAVPVRGALFAAQWIVDTLMAAVGAIARLLWLAVTLVLLPIRLLLTFAARGTMALVRILVQPFLWLGWLVATIVRASWTGLGLAVTGIASLLLSIVYGVASILKASGAALVLAMAAITSGLITVLGWLLAPVRFVWNVACAVGLGLQDIGMLFGDVIVALGRTLGRMRIWLWRGAGALMSPVVAVALAMVSGAIQGCLAAAHAVAWSLEQVLHAIGVTLTFAVMPIVALLRLIVTILVVVFIVAPRTVVTRIVGPPLIALLGSVASGIAFAIRIVLYALAAVFVGLGAALGGTALLIGIVFRGLISGLMLVARPPARVVALLARGVVLVISLAIRGAGAGIALLFLLVSAPFQALFALVRLLWIGASTLTMIAGLGLRAGAQSVERFGIAAATAAGPAPDFVPGPIWLGIAGMSLIGQTGLRLIPIGEASTVGNMTAGSPGFARGLGEGDDAMSVSNPRMTREAFVGVIALVWAVGAVFGLFVLWPREKDPVVVNHWANTYMMDAPVFPELSKQFNDERHRTASGQRIEVRPIFVNSSLIAEEVISRVKTGQPSGFCNQAAGGCFIPPLPILITPAADHWFPYINHGAGRTVIDPADSPLLGTTYNGIVMQREMARCFGWPDREVGFADILALRNDPNGWASCSRARPEWGQQVKISYSDPFSSSTGRSVLYSLYGIGAGKQPESLNDADIRDTAAFIRSFQDGVDHYVPDTTVLARKMIEGPRFGQIFFFPENNFVTLKRGLTTVRVPGESKPRSLEQDMVMIYPKEGSPANRHSAAFVHANWVTPEEREAAQKWVDFLRAPTQQRLLVERGFRPATPGVPWEDVISPANGVDPRKPTVIANPDNVDPAAAQAILESWGNVKKPGIVTFVMDTSGSMAGEKMEQAKKGMTSVLSQLDPNTRLGFLTFSNQVHTRIPVGPIKETQYQIVQVVDAARPGGETNLYDAIADAIEMTDTAEPDLQAIRGIVVMTDGKANRGRPLDQIVRLSANERPVRSCGGFEGGKDCLDEAGRVVTLDHVLGEGLAMPVTHREIHIFYVGLGADVDIHVGRILASATGSTYVPATAQNIAAVLENFGKYF